MTEVRKKYGEKVFKTKIRKNISVAQAPLAGESLLDFAPNCNAVQDYLSLTKEILNRFKNNQKK